MEEYERLRAEAECHSHNHDAALDQLEAVRAQRDELLEALRLACETEASVLWNRCLDCDTPGSCTGEKLCIVGERSHKWLGRASAAIAKATGEVQP